VTADDSNDNRSRILDAAATEFMNAGFDATSIDDIARRIGQTKGLIYYHFRSKIDIFYAVYERGMRQVRGEVAPQVSAPGTGMERLRRMARAHVADLLLNLGYHDVMRQGVEKRMRMKLTDPQREAGRRLGTLRDEYESLFRLLISEGVEDGSIRQLPVTVAARTLIGGLNAVAIWYRNQAEQPPLSEMDDLATQIADVLVGGFAGQRDARTRPHSAAV
jgi:AcrR family transcriptional regulator